MNAAPKFTPADVERVAAQMLPGYRSTLPGNPPLVLCQSYVRARLEDDDEPFIDAVAGALWALAKVTQS